jgi:hypothetical protein
MMLYDNNEGQIFKELEHQSRNDDLTDSWIW